MNTKKKKKSKWKKITIIDENGVEIIRTELSEYGELPKGFYANSRKSRLKDYYTTLGERPSFFGNFKDPPKATSSIDVTSDSSTQSEEINNKHTNESNSIETGQKSSQNNANNSLLDNKIQDNKNDEQDDLQNLLSTDYFDINDPFNYHNNWPEI